MLQNPSTMSTLDRLLVPASWPNEGPKQPPHQQRCPNSRNSNFRCNTRRRKLGSSSNDKATTTSSHCDLHLKISIITMLMVALQLTLAQASSVQRQRDSFSRHAALQRPEHTFKRPDSKVDVSMDEEETRNQFSFSQTPAAYQFEASRLSRGDQSASGDDTPALTSGSALLEGSTSDGAATSETTANDEESTSSAGSGDQSQNTEEDSQEASDNLHILERHNMNLRAMHDMFERRQLLSPANQQYQQQQQQQSSSVAPLQSSQELSPISIGLDPGSPFGLGNPFSMAEGVPPPPPQPVQPMQAHKPQMANADNLDPALPFGLNPLPHLLGFQGGPATNGFDGPQRGDQSAHTNHHASAPAADQDSPVGSSQKVWPKIFRFTDGRINLSDFEKQKKIRLSNKNHHAGGENHIESAPIMFDGRQLKRKSFLILHGGIFSRRR